jgi:hypothetical protein
MIGIERFDRHHRITRDKPLDPAVRMIIEIA